MTTDNRKKILFCYVEYHHYRVPIWNELGRRYDVTVLHGSTAQTDGQAGFNEIPCPPRKLGRFRYQPGLVREVRKSDYDAVIFLFDLAWLSHLLGFFLCPRSTRRISWGFWETKSELANKARFWLAKRADGNVFYSTGAAQYFFRKGLNPKKIWIARNTVKVDPAERDTSHRRDALLFLGSFNVRKGNDVTIAAFNDACSQIPEHIQLVLVGDGPAKAAAQAQAAGLPNGHRIVFRHGTLDANEIREYYARALASVSFGQAGLSVLQSFGHGVTFITKKGAISGGESENILPGQTGLICDPNQDSLRDAVITLCNDPVQAEALGQGALSYYKTRASAQTMAEGFAEAVENTYLKAKLVS
ncbi:glycosyltransferase family 4 protein [Antarctobacter heliothermus]|uniref:Glycosyl transferases group 1 n=1 Tax=Antarctobacter heliothermus TaxID=74033 RepID=A0A239DA14_9RHOB|nr:glycosyltransferase family 4 protein [Antarctobacter heliothermus]SNS28918.1 Glycosyl transferases group 1 [Antarctobacter heliothermus]